MAEVKVLIKGFTSADAKKSGAEKEETQCTTSLIRDEDIIIVSDPGVLDNKNVLIDALKKENLTLEDVTHIFITHSHIDHYRNLGMFPASTKILEYYGIWYNNVWAEDVPKKLTKNIEIIKTPGHNYTSLSMLVKTSRGKVAVVGDVFWKEDYPEEDPYADNPEKLKESREKILKIADWIVPGHADMFKVSK